MDPNLKYLAQIVINKYIRGQEKGATVSDCWRDAWRTIPENY